MKGQGTGRCPRPPALGKSRRQAETAARRRRAETASLGAPRHDARPRWARILGDAPPARPVPLPGLCGRQRRRTARQLSPVAVGALATRHTGTAPFCVTVLVSHALTYADGIEASQATRYIAWVIRSQKGQRRGLCYDTHHIWAVAVTVTIPDKLPCVLGGGFVRKNFRINSLQRG